MSLSNIYPVWDLLELKGLVLWNDTRRMAVTQGGHGMYERHFGEGPEMMVFQ